MMLSTAKLNTIAIVALLASASCAAAQTAYDPMSAARGAPLSGEREGATAAPNPEFEGLPDTEGAEETYYQCVACHSTAIIQQQSLSDARWDYLWNWMVEEQGMYEPDEETKTIVLTYLKRHFSSER